MGVRNDDNAAATTKEQTMAKAEVKNGVVVKLEPGADTNDYVTCDRCGRTFQIKYTICVCRG